MKNSNRGVVFVSVLLIVVVVAMFTGAFLVRSRGTLFGAASYRDGVRAEQAARAGVNHLLTILENDNSFAQDFEVQLGQASYSVTFDPDNPHFSVNNLTSINEATQLSCQGYKVAARTADLVVVGRCGTSRRTLRAVAQQGVTAGRSVAAVGRIELKGQVALDGVTSASGRVDTSQTPPAVEAVGQAPGGLLSKHQAVAGGPPAIEWTGGPGFTLGELSRLETAPPKTGGQAVSSNLLALHEDKVISEGAGTTISDIDVSAYVAAGMSSPTLPGGPILSGYVSIVEEKSVAGDLLVNGDIVLSEGTLYVDGDLTINGGISGVGTVYVSGNVSVLGGNALIQTGQPSGAAVFAGGDVELMGIDALGYLDAMASGNPSFQTAVSRLRGGLSSYLTTTNFWGHSVQMAKHYDPYNHPDSQTPWLSPIPGPNGTFNTGRSNGIVPAVLIHLKSIPGYESDPRILKVMRALEQTQYHFRHNRHNVRADMRTLAPGGDPSSIIGGGEPIIRTDEYRPALADPGGNLVPVPAADFDNSSTDEFLLDHPHWDDESYPDPTSWTHDRIGSLPPSLQTQVHLARRDAFIEHNPVDMAWLGRSAFQGVIYARGDVRADTNFSVLGAVISLGDVHLGNGSTMIFNQEYLSLFGARLPLGLVHVEEI